MPTTSSSYSKVLRLLSIVMLTLFAAGCAVVLHSKYDDLWGLENAARRAVTARTLNTEQATAHFYQKKIKPIFDSRCAVCHGCYDAPCQTKLTSYEGLERGGSKEAVYDGARLLAIRPTRLFTDADTPSQWRAKGFHPILNERELSDEANIGGSVLARLLTQKEVFPLPKENKALDGFDFSLDRSQVCPTIDEMDAYIAEHPQWGMPFGFPAISDKEYQSVQTWIAAGAKYQDTTEIPKKILAQISRWEKFFNEASLKQQLVSRYLYEHLFLAHLYFSNSSTKMYFKLVRSKSPPGEPIQKIATVRPYGDPGVSRVYYRLTPVKSSIVLKRHMPYALHAKRLARYRELFITPEYKVTSLPSYKIEDASDPFTTFHQLPAVSRYKFLLDEAQFSIMNYIKGPVCRGQIALNVIRDRFWVVFLNPDLPFLQNAYQSLGVKGEGAPLLLPAEAGSNSLALSNWLRYAANEKTRLKESAAYVDKEVYAKHLANLNLIWDGDGNNKNAALTIFRHFDNASVHKGFIGDEPETVWVIDYSLFERIHYLLVAGFDVFGNVGHQLNTRLYMDFLRMEGEARFLGLLPPNVRKRLRDQWYRDAPERVKDYVYGEYTPKGKSVNITFRTTNPKRELIDRIGERLGNSLEKRYTLDSIPKSVRMSLERLATFKGEKVSLLPQLSFLQVEGLGVFSLINNSHHRNISHLFGERSERDFEQDTLTVAKGFIGAHPNMFFKVRKDQLDTFVSTVLALRDEKTYAALLTHYGVRRNKDSFWETSDELHAAAKRFDGLESGIFDYNRYENR